MADSKFLDKSKRTFQWKNNITDILISICNSPSFWMDNEEWFFQFYGSHFCNKVTLYLQRKSEGKSCLMLCSLSLKVGSKLLQNATMECSYHGRKKFETIAQISKSELHDYADGTPLADLLILECSILSINLAHEEIAQTDLTSPLPFVYAGSLSKSFQAAFLCEDFSDVKIKVGPKEFPAHKIVLAARSPVFSAMFKHKMSESINGIIEIKDCDPYSFEAFLKFLYTGLADQITSSNAQNIYEIANKYGMLELVGECRDHLSNTLAIDNICDIIDLSVTHDEKELLELATNFFINNSKDIFNTEKWMAYMVERTSVANKCLKKLAEAYSGLKFIKTENYSITD